MLNFLLVSPHRELLSSLASALAEHEDVHVSWAASGSKALEIALEMTQDLVVTDESLGDMTGLELIGRLIQVNPIINCAAVSSLSPHDFHEASEGLGVMSQLPVRPGKKEADDLVQGLRKLKELEAGLRRE